MPTTTVVRALAPSEAMFAEGQSYTGFVFMVRGQLDTAAMAAALDAVTVSYPALGTRLAETENGHVLVAGAKPRVFVSAGDPTRPFSTIDLDQADALVGIGVVRDGDTASVTMWMHHSVSDGENTFAVLTDLWSCYTDIVAGQQPQLPVHPFPAPIEQLFAERGIEKMPLPELFQLVGATGLPAAPPPGAGPETVVAQDDPPVADESGLFVPCTARCQLDEETSAALARVGHREGVTVNALVSAAALRAEAGARDLPLTKLFLSYAVSLRGRLTPEVTPAEGTNVLGFAFFAPTEDVGADPLALARAITTSLRDGLASGLVQQMALLLPDMASGGDQSAPSAEVLIMTNVGRVARPRTPEGLRVTDFRSVLAQRRGRVQQPSTVFSGLVSSFDGRLSVEVHYPDERTADLQQRRMDMLRDELTAMAADAS